MRPLLICLSALHLTRSDRITLIANTPCKTFRHEFYVSATERGKLTQDYVTVSPRLTFGMKKPRV
jgi:hypothetical protein